VRLLVSHIATMHKAIQPTDSVLLLIAIVQAREHETVWLPRRPLFALRHETWNVGVGILLYRHDHVSPQRVASSFGVNVGES
jgi:hypothetical protein